MNASPEFATDTEWIARTDTVSVKVNTLGPGRGSPWHFHTVVADDVFALDDGIEVGLRGPDETVRLVPGQHVHVIVGRVHRVVNRASAPARYLLVQATGTYDFQVVSDPGAGGDTGP
ncbi:MAG TPA: cupin domain-containing protein [Anaeromyxobacter sp.]|nr:cupin domain-containing protein [Anaeromyxobacter sp.]HVP61128.1 cupin domain-containing protein [Myxococcaceae bacterium]